MRKAWIAAAAGAFVLLSVSVVQARISQYRDKPLDRQNIGRIVAGASTTSETFGGLGGWGFSDGPGISARGAIAVTVSITIEGGPLAVRLVTEAVDRDFAQHNMRPSSAWFDPGGGSQSFSYTFVANVPAGHYTVNILWRSPTGVQVTETGGSVVIQYARAS